MLSFNIILGINIYDGGNTKRIPRWLHFVSNPCEDSNDVMLRDVRMN